MNNIFLSTREWVRRTAQGLLTPFVKTVPLVPVVRKPVFPPVELSRRSRHGFLFTRRQRVALLRMSRWYYHQDLKGKGLGRQECRKIARQMVRFAPAQ